MILTRTHDMAIVERICRDPAVWRHLHDDGTAAEWAPVDHEAMHWMLISIGGAPAGVFLVHPLNSFCFEMHTCLLPVAWGAPAAEAAQMLLRWAFTETPCKKMVTNVPIYNRAALRFARAGGMTQEGVNRASFMRNGVLLDQVALGITFKEWKSCH